MYYNFKDATDVVYDTLSTRSGRDFEDLKKFLADDIEAATEAIDRRSGARMNGYTSKYLNYLVEKTASKADKVNWGKIPQSRGNIQKWDVYKHISEILDRILKCNFNDELINMTIELNRNIVTYRSDFEYGYKTDNTVIILTYQAACLALCDLAFLSSIRLETMLYNQIHARTALSIRTDRKTTQLIKSVKQLNKCFESGEWSKMVRTIRTTRIEAFHASQANQALESAAAVTAGIATFALIAAVSITGAIALIGAIRGLITIYYRTAVTIDQKARSMQEYLNETIPYETNKDAAEKQTRARDKLDRIAGWIEAHIINDSDRAEKEIHDEDRKEVSPAALSAPSDDIMDNIQFY